MQEKKKENRSPESMAKRKAYTAAWNKEKTETILIRVRKGKKEAYKAAAAARGQSLTGMIVEYLDTQIEQEL